ncbi:MAG: glutathione S-transferase family protein [Polyangiaceae bacterium]|nr:glutathione S-transferase family protein [Polyangiaceae bacterium]
MTKPRLTYFDAPVSRGEECRLALALAGVEFEDVRISRDQWAELKPSAPFGTVPYLEVEGHAAIGQTNAILTLIGRLHGLHPSDPFEAARHEAVMAHVEDLRVAVGQTLWMTDADEKRRAREALVADTFPAWGGITERHIGERGFFAGDTAHVVDVKLYGIVRWFLGGKVDHIPADVFAAFPRLLRVHAAVDAHPRVRAWQGRA